MNNNDYSEAPPKNVHEREFLDSMLEDYLSCIFTRETLDALITRMFQQKPTPELRERIDECFQQLRYVKEEIDTIHFYAANSPFDPL